MTQKIKCVIQTYLFCVIFESYNRVVYKIISLTMRFGFVAVAVTKKKRFCRDAEKRSGGTHLTLVLEKRTKWSCLDDRGFSTRVSVQPPQTRGLILLIVTERSMLAREVGPASLGSSATLFASVLLPTLLSRLRDTLISHPPLPICRHPNHRIAINYLLTRNFLIFNLV